MPLPVVFDSDGLIKLAKAGALERVLEAWTCLVPRAVYVETVERGLEAAYPDAAAISVALVLSSAAHAIVTDDAVFVAALAGAGLRYLLPALVLVRLVQEQRLQPAEALDHLERMRPFIRAEVYRAARSRLTAVQRG